jgi:predicted nucleic acid-binding protein
VGRAPRRVLLDTGPLVSWLDRGDAHHATITRWMTAFRGELLTTWPVLTEVCHLVPDRAAPVLLRWVESGGATLMDIPVASLHAIAARMEKYADLPMDLADASLVWVAEREGVMDILTLDKRNFGIYRTARGRMLRDALGRAR